MSRLYAYLGRWRRGSTFLLLVSLVGFAVLMHPSLTGFLLIVANGGFLFVIREVARAEGAAGFTGPWTLLIALGVIVACGFAVMSIPWVGVYR